MVNASSTAPYCGSVRPLVILCRACQAASSWASVLSIGASTPLSDSSPDRSAFFKTRALLSDSPACSCAWATFLASLPAPALASEAPCATLPLPAPTLSRPLLNRFEPLLLERNPSASLPEPTCAVPTAESSALAPSAAARKPSVVAVAPSWAREMLLLSRPIPSSWLSRPFSTPPSCLRLSSKLVKPAIDATPGSLSTRRWKSASARSRPGVVTGRSRPFTATSSGPTQPGPSARWMSSCCWRPGSSGGSWAIEPVLVSRVRAQPAQTTRTKRTPSTSGIRLEIRVDQRITAPPSSRRGGSDQRSRWRPSTISNAGATNIAESTLRTATTIPARAIEETTAPGISREATSIASNSPLPAGITDLPVAIRVVRAASGTSLPARVSSRNRETTSSE